jgi:hypothetical protein
MLINKLSISFDTLFSELSQNILELALSIFFKYQKEETERILKHYLVKSSTIY